MATARQQSGPQARGRSRKATPALGYRPTRGPLAGQRFASEYGYRVALATVQGYDSPRAKRYQVKPVRTPWEFDRLDPPERLAYERALHALHLGRQYPRWSLKHVARLAHTTPENVLAYTGASFQRDAQGRFRAKPRDQLLRRLTLPAPRGLVPVDVTDSRTASTIGRYWAAIKRFVRTGNERALWPFRGNVVRVGKVAYSLLTDPITLRRLLEADVISPESIYRDTT